MTSEQETTMLWKVEPLSPSGTPPLDIDDEWLCLDEKPALLFPEDGEEAVLYEEQLTRAQVASKFLEELELGKNWIKEESFADWLEEKIDLPIFEELPVPECGQNRAIVYPAIIKPHQQQHQVQIQPQIIVGNHHHHHHHHQQVDATQSLLQEFETVLGDVEACHQIAGVSTLTPPQSPPPIKQQFVTGLPVTLQTGNAHLLVSLQPLHQQAGFVYDDQQHREESATITLQPQQQHQQQQPGTYGVPTITLPGGLEQQQHQQQQQPQIADQWSGETTLSLDPLVHSNDVANELAKVDEYVRSCAEDVAATPGNHNIICNNNNLSSNASSISSSAPPSPCDSSNASVTSEDSADDPDWSYESNLHASTSSSTSSSRKLTSSSNRSNRRSNKPYSRNGNVEDKRVRKKEQNKNAATRYRQKKKQEIKEILGEEQELVKKNDKLQSQVKDLQREIGYLKNLMRDLFKAKGLMK